MKSKVFKLRCLGFNLGEIAKKLQVPESKVSKVFRFRKKKSNLVVTFPELINVISFNGVMYKKIKTKKVA